VTIASRITFLDLFCDCSQTMDVTGVECLQGLLNVNLSGAYANLDRMRYLPRLTDVSIQYGDGSLYPELAVLPHLHSLDLENDQMSDLSALAPLTTLTDLNLDGNQVIDLTPLAGLENLVSLDLGANQVTDLTPLANLHQLQKLVLRYNTVSDLSPLAGLTSLLDLQLGQNPFTNLGPLSGLVNIQSLDINSTQPLTDFSPLVKNTGLGTGDTVYSNPALSDCASFKTDLQTLTNRGVTLVGFPTCP
jgi:Leucine-rich repeat (LRR) protein